MNVWERKIIHVDMDAFFAAIEQRDNPSLRGKPVVVGGEPNGRGVVSTASYEARKFGIHSAMAASQAKRLCPHAVFLRPRFQKYSEDSAVIMGILRQYTLLVEPVSLDEAYLDVTDNKLKIGDPVAIAKLIKQNLYAALKLTASAGVAPNLFLSKVASDFKKPDGLTVVYPHQIREFLENLPVRKIPGVGPVTEEELTKCRIRTCGELAAANPHFLYQRFGKWGLALHERANGKDPRQVEPETESKQYSTEETFPKDLLSIAVMQEKLKSYAQEVFFGLRESGRMGRTVILKVKYHDFETITRSKTLLSQPQTWMQVYETACSLFLKKTLAGKKPIRLLGIGISGLEPTAPERNRQYDFFEGLPAAD